MIDCISYIQLNLRLKTLSKLEYLLHIIDVDTALNNFKIQSMTTFIMISTLQLSYSNILGETCLMPHRKVLAFLNWHVTLVDVHTKTSLKGRVPYTKTNPKRVMRTNDWNKHYAAAETVLAFYFRLGEIQTGCYAWKKIIYRIHYFFWLSLSRCWTSNGVNDGLIYKKNT